MFGGVCTSGLSLFKQVVIAERLGLFKLLSLSSKLPHCSDQSATVLSHLPHLFARGDTSSVYLLCGPEDFGFMGKVGMKS